MEIEKLKLEELIKLNKEVSERLHTEFDFFNIISTARSWHKSEENEDGSVSLIPYTTIYTNEVDLYHACKQATDNQVEYLKKHPQFQTYLNPIIDRETGEGLSFTDNLIQNKL